MDGKRLSISLWKGMKKTKLQEAKKMAILVCDTCTSKVKTPKCCGREMELKGSDLVCSECENKVEVNYCCGHAMHEKI